MVGGAIAELLVSIFFNTFFMWTRCTCMCTGLRSTQDNMGELKTLVWKTRERISYGKPIKA